MNFHMLEQKNKFHTIWLFLFKIKSFLDVYVVSHAWLNVASQTETIIIRWGFYS